MIKVAIVEDDVACSNELKSFFVRYQEKINIAIEVERFENADKFLENYQNGIYQMVFMDIEMPGTDGMRNALIQTGRRYFGIKIYRASCFNKRKLPLWELGFGRQGYDYHS